MNDAFRLHVQKSLAKNIRLDGRRLDEFRPITLEYGISKNAEGSARVRIGETEVLAGVKMSIETPYPDVPEQGNLMVNAELLPMSSPEFETGPPDAESVELARIVDRGIRESRALDLKKLCIVPGSKVWGIAIDICTINHDGNLIDAASLAAVAAVKSARFPKYEGEKINYKEMTDQPLPVAARAPVTVTVVKIGNSLLVDPSYEEEKFCDARLTVAISEGRICAMQKGGDAGLGFDEVDRMVALAMAKAEEVSSRLGL